MLEVQRDVGAVRRGLVGEPIRIELPTPPALTPSVMAEARPSLAVQAKQGAGLLGKYGPWAVGVLTLLSELASIFRPDYVGPIRAILRLLLGAP